MTATTVSPDTSATTATFGRRQELVEERGKRCGEIGSRTSRAGELLQVSSNTIASRYRYALGRLRGSLIAEENFSANS